MKKNCLLLVLILMSIGMSAQNYSTQQKKLISQISSYLSTEGYLAESQKDGLKFKHEGVNYYVEVSEEDQSPMFVRLCRYVKYSETIKQEDVVKKLNTYNAKLGIKVSCQENSLSIAAEMFVSSSSDLTDVFPTLLQQIKATYSQITD